MTTLVTGGSGMLGQHLQDYLCDDAEFLSSVDADLTKTSDVQYIMYHYKPDRVIHLAAKVGGLQDNMKYPADFFNENVLMNTNLLVFSHEVGVKRFTAMLSTCIYPDVVKSYPMKEENLFDGPPPEGNFSYAYAKRSMAVQIDAMNAQYGTKYNYIIPCNLYGENDNFFHRDKMHFVTALLQKLKESNGSIQLLGTGKPLRQFMHTDDLARIIKRVVDEDITESFNAAPDFNMSIKEMAEEAIDALCDKDIEINWTQPELDGQYRKDVSSEKLLSLLPDFKFTSFREGGKRVWKTLS